jgi:hypothetical protein
VRALVLAVAIALAGSVSAADAPIFRFELAALPEYTQGFPMLIALTLTNVTTNCGVNNVPGWTPFGLAQAQLTFFFTDGAGKRYEIALPHEYGDIYGEDYGPKQARRMLLDLSLVDGLPPAGTYTLEVVLDQKNDPALSNPVRIVLRHPSRAEAAAAAKISHGESWGDFVDGKWQMGKLPPLPPRVQQQLALHLFVRRVVHAPEKLSEIPLSWLDALAHGLYAPEGEAYRIELLVARKDPRARVVADALIARTPGLRDDVAATLSGSSELHIMRQSLGTDPPDPTP